MTAAPRARDLGIPFAGEPGRWNAITDVPGLEVGYRTLVDAERGVRTGVTAIHPRGRGGAGDPCVAGFHSQNGQGEMTGVHWVQESGTFSGPVLFTSTYAIPAAFEGAVRWTGRHHPAASGGWLLPVVAETWDGYLHDVRGFHLSADDALAALEDARPGPLAEGAVGGGTGMVCYGFKGGTGSASRLVAYGGETYAVGVLVQANFGARRELTIAGVPLGALLADDDPKAAWYAAPEPPAAGSIIVLVATDAPLLPSQCAALARRATYGLARTGSGGDHFSGDLFLACSVANAGAITPEDDALRSRAPERLDALRFVPWGHMDPFNRAVVHATEEAIVNALVAGEETVGHEGRRVPGLPRERVARAIRDAVAARPHPKG
ncbi:MAG TPA: P1 family peptidase [Conexibacter sp.]|nr:P1 family peptidase [Conexibacter sp.]